MKAPAPFYHVHDQDERAIARRLVNDIIDNGYRITVYDGGAYPVQKSKKPMEVFAALGTTDMDTLTIYGRTRNCVGSVTLVYGNGLDLIADHTNNETMRHLVRGAEAVAKARGF